VVTVGRQGEHGQVACQYQASYGTLTPADRPAHNSCVLANLPVSGEPVLLEELDCDAEQETARSLAAGRHLRDCLDETAAGLGDLVNCTFHRGMGDSLAAMLLADPRST
jgi:hypothetical protein